MEISFVYQGRVISKKSFKTEITVPVANSVMPPKVAYDLKEALEDSNFTRLLTGWSSDFLLSSRSYDDDGVVFLAKPEPDNIQILFKDKAGRIFHKTEIETTQFLNVGGFVRVYKNLFKNVLNDLNMNHYEDDTQNRFVEAFFV